MNRILIPDSGPLFSLAAGGLLDVLGHFSVAITDVVKLETIDRGELPGASVEAKSIAAFYKKHKANIHIVETQVGHIIDLAKRQDPTATLTNAGELSIQSLIIHLTATSKRQSTLVLFEDGWFMRNHPSFPASCLLLSTSAFLQDAERLKLIPSAEKAQQAVLSSRPTFFEKDVRLTKTRSVDK